MTKDIVIGRATPANTVVVYPNVQELFERTEPPKKVKVATGCPLCDEIWSSAEAYKDFCEHSYREKIAIVMENGKPWLYIPCEDDYYSDTRLQINYCPKCRRKLVEECI